MKRIVEISLLFVLLLLVFVIFISKMMPTNYEQISGLRLTSPAFVDKGTIPSQYTCKGKDLNPPLAISETPADSQSLALVVFDPDAPFQTWYHWIVWNIPASTTFILENTVPSNATQGTNSFKDRKYRGPCPPSGRHHYIFKLIALDTTLTLPEEATIDDFNKVIRGHVLGQTHLTGVYP